MKPSKMLKFSCVAALTIAASFSSIASVNIEYDVTPELNLINVNALEPINHWGNTYFGNTYLWVPQGQTFTLTSATVTDADSSGQAWPNDWSDPNSLPFVDTGATVTGYLNGQEVYFLNPALTTGATTTLTLNFGPVDTVIFSSGNFSDGLRVTATDFVGSGFAAAVPEPESYALLLAGLGIVGLSAKRRNRTH